MKVFVGEHSIVRKIWGKADTILFIFAGSSAEFALSKAVDWLYFTGRLPADPLGRLFSTVSYARKIIFSEYNDAVKAIHQISAIHQNVEESRGTEIPDWAYRDVLYMLIDYSIRSFEVLERKLSEEEKEDVFSVFYNVGLIMGIKELPQTYHLWLISREEHLKADLIQSPFTTDLFLQYKKHLGSIRFQILKQAQILVIPETVNRLLSFGKTPFLYPIVQIFKVTRYFKVDHLIKDAVFPINYRMQIKDLDVNEPCGV